MRAARCIAAGVVLLAGSTATASAQSLSIGGYTLVSERRITRTDYEYTYRAVLSNGGTAVRSAAATVASSATATTVVEGTLAFGPVPSGGTAASDDTFTIRHNRTVPFSFAVLTWTIAPVYEPANRVPVADPGAPQSAPVGTIVTLDASASHDPDGDALTYAWTVAGRPAGSAGTLSDASAVRPTFTVDAAGSYTFRLVVTDAHGAASEPAFVEVSTGNSAPVARAGADQTVDRGALVQLRGGASSDPDGDALSFLWALESVPAGSGAALSDPRAVEPTFLADRRGDFVVRLTVSDPSGASALDMVTITTRNSAPEADAGPDQSAAVGSLVEVDASGSTDVDGDALTYLWSFTSVPSGSQAELHDAAAPRASFVVDQPGLYVLQVVVSDGAGGSGVDTAAVSTVNSRPLADAGPDQATAAGGAVTLDGRGSRDPDGDPLTFAWALVAVPDGSTAALSDSASDRPAFVADRPGTYVAQLAVSDASLTSGPDTVTITTGNTAPVAHAGDDPPRRALGHAVALDGRASSDADGHALTFAWSILSAPPGSAPSLDDPSSPTPSFAPAAGGDYVVQLIVHDGFVSSAPDTVLVRVNRPPLANAGGDVEVPAGSTVSSNGGGSMDPDGDALTFEWTLVAPAGSGAFLLNAATAAPSFVADVAGPYELHLVVGDGLNASDPDTAVVTATASLSLSLSPPESDVPTFTTTSLTVTASRPAPAGGTLVMLSSSSESVVTVPESVTIAGGESTASFEATSHATAGSATISAVSSGTSGATATVNVEPRSMSLTLDSSTLDVHGQATGTIALGHAASPGGASIAVVSADAGVAAAAPSLVRIEAGAWQGTFAVFGIEGGATTLAASAQGFTGASTDVSVHRTLSLGPAPFEVERSAVRTVTLTLSAAAPAGGVSVSLFTDAPATASVPEAVLVPGGQSSIDVPVTGLLQGSTTLHAAASFAIPATLPVTVTPASPAVIESSPAHGEGGVAVTREFILRFSRALANPELITGDGLVARFGGTTLPARVQVSQDHRAVTLFYLQTLPPSARVRVTFDTGGLLDVVGVPLDGDRDGTPGGIAVVDFDTLTLTTLPGTAVVGRVFASELGDGGVNTPLAGVIVGVDGLETTLRTTTDAMGNFRLEPAPAGAFFVHIDGRAATNGVPVGAYYPVVGKKWEAKPGVVTTVADAFLPLVVAGTLQPVSRTADTVVAFPPSVLSQHPELDGVRITVPADALYSDNGARGGMVGIAPVPPDRIPSPLPPGLRFPVVITVQTDGATNFDRPVPACFPNLPDPATGLRLGPGAKTALWSFNHDIGDWEIVGPMTVSPDGSLACTNAGVGIRQPGWHGVQSGVQAQKIIADALGGVVRIGDFFITLQSECEAPLAAYLWAWYNYLSDATVIGGAARRSVEGSVKAFTYAARGSNRAGIARRIRTAAKAWGKATLRANKPDIRDLANDSLTAIGMGTLQGKSPDDIVRDVAGEWQGFAEEVAAHTLRQPVWFGKIYFDTLRQDIAAVEEAAQIWSQRCAEVFYPPVDLIPVVRPASPVADIRPATEDVALAEGWPAPTTDQLAAVQSAFEETGSVESALPKMFADLVFVADEIATIDEVLANPSPSAESVVTLRGALERLAPRARSFNDFTATLDALHVSSDRAVQATSTASLADSVYYAFSYPAADDETVLRGQTSGGALEGRLPSDSPVTLTVYEPRASRVGRIVFRTGTSGTRQADGTPVVLRDATNLPDGDGDGIPDVAETAIGTDPADADTDGDGTSDGSEARQGSNPLDGVAAATGIVATADLPGSAVDVAARNDVAVVASAESGVTIVNVAAGLDPVIVALVDTPGRAQAVAFEASLVAVADGPGGLAVVDIADPPAARIVRQVDAAALGGEATTVTVAGGTAYVGVRGATSQVAAVDLVTGAVTDRVGILGAVNDLAFARDELYVLTFGELYIYSTQGGFALLGTIPVSGAPSPSQNGRPLFVGGDVAYVGTFTGYVTVDVGNPRAPVVVGMPPTTQLAVHDITANGSGLVVATTSFGGVQTLAVSLYDGADPADVTRFLTSIDTPGDSRALSLYNGLAYIADSEAGLQVVNYRAFDTGGVAPTVSLESNFTLGAAAGTAEEGKVMRLTAVVADDVQVRNVEFFVDGVSAARDGNFPFEHRFLTPPLDERPSLTVRACASDTGGNTSCTAAIVVTLIPETTPPRVTVVVPSNGAVVAENSVTSIAATFSEPIDPRTLTTATFQVLAPGDVPGPATAVSYNEQTNSAVLVLPAPLAVGSYTGIVRSAVTDLAGNGLAADHRWPFTVRREKRWISDASGFWDDGARWSDGVAPVAGDLVVIDRPASDVTVTIRTSAAARSIRAGEAVVVSSVGSLATESTASFAGGLTLAGGLSGPAAISAATFTWTGGNIAAGGELSVSGTATLSPSMAFITGRTLRLGSSTLWSGGSGSTIHVQSGARIVNPAGGVLVLSGTTRLEHSGDLNNATPFVNEGTLRKIDATSANLAKLHNDGAVDLAAGTLIVGGQQTFLMASSGGSFTGTAGTTLSFGADNTLTSTSQIGTAGTVELAGTTRVAGAFSANAVVFLSGSRTTFSGTIGSLGAANTLTVPSNADVTFDVETPLTFSHVTMTGGFLAGTATLTTGGLTWSSGSIEIPELTVTGTSSLSGSMGFFGTRLTLGTSTVWTGGGLSVDETVVVNGAGAVWDLPGDGLMTGRGATILNAGTMRKTQPGTLQMGFAPGSRFDLNGIALENSGIFDLRAGAAIVESGRSVSTATGIFTGAAGTRLRFAGTHVLTPASRVETGGTVEFSGTTTVAGMLDAASMTMTGSYVGCPQDSFPCFVFNSVTTFSGHVVSPIPALALNRHDLVFTGSVPPIGDVTIDGSPTNLAGAGSLTFDTTSPAVLSSLTIAAGRLRGSGSATVGALTWTRGVVEIAALRVTGHTLMSSIALLGTTLTLGSSTTSLPGTEGHVVVQDGARILNPAGSVWELQGAVRLPLVCCSQVLPAIVNDGIIRKTGPGTAALELSVNNHGTVDLTEGSLVLGSLGSGDSVSSGSFIGAAGTTLRWAASVFPRGDGAPGSTTLASGSSVNTPGAVEFAGFNLLPSAPDAFAAVATLDGVLNAGTVRFVDAIATLAGTFTAGTMTVENGPALATTVAVTASPNAGALAVNSGVLEGTGGFTAGTLTWSGGTIRLPTLSVAGATTISGAGVKNLSGTELGLGSLTTWAAGTLRLSNGASIENPPGAVLRFDTDALVDGIGAGLTLANRGTLEFAGPARAVSFANVGFVNEGTQVHRLGGLAAFDRLEVTGQPVAFAGTLDVRLMGGFAPSPGDAFTLITYPSRTGTFSAVEGNGETYAPVYGVTALTLVKP